MSYTTQVLDGPKPVACTDDKLNTSLDNDLATVPDETSNILGSPSSSDTINSFRSCRHINKIIQDAYDTCVSCGAFVSKAGIKSFKNKKNDYSVFFPPETIYETITKRSCQFAESLNPDYAQTRQKYVDWTLELASNLGISINSTHLAVLLLDIVMFEDPSLMSKLQLYASVCLLVAAKTIELDARIPFLPKLRRYTNVAYSVDEYRKAELYVLDLVDWNPQYSSALEICEFLMCQGILFSNDHIEDGKTLESKSPLPLKENTQHENLSHLDLRNNEGRNTSEDIEKYLSPRNGENREKSFSETSTNATNTDNVSTPINNNITPRLQTIDENSPFSILPLSTKNSSSPMYLDTKSSVKKAKTPVIKNAEEILTHFELGYSKLCTDLLRDIQFIGWEARVVSASILAFFRHSNKVTPIWNPELEALTNLKFSHICDCFDLMYKKYNMKYAVQTQKLREAIERGDNKRGTVSDFEIQRAKPNDMILGSQLRYDLGNRASTGKDTYTTRLPAISNRNINYPDISIPEHKPFERKPVFSYQTKNNTATTVNSATVNSYSYLRDEQRYKAKYNNGTVKSELPQRGSGMVHSSVLAEYQPGRIVSNNENLNRFSSGATSALLNRPSATGSSGKSYLTSGQSGLSNDSYLRIHSSSRNSAMPSMNNRPSASSFESGFSYKSKLGMLKK